MIAYGTLKFFTKEGENTEITLYKASDYFLKSFATWANGQEITQDILTSDEVLRLLNTLR